MKPFSRNKGDTFLMYLFIDFGKYKILLYTWEKCTRSPALDRYTLWFEDFIYLLTLLIGRMNNMEQLNWRKRTTVFVWLVHFESPAHHPKLFRTYIFRLKYKYKSINRGTLQSLQLTNWMIFKSYRRSVCVFHITVIVIDVNDKFIRIKSYMKSYTFFPECTQLLPI